MTKKIKCQLISKSNTTNGLVQKNVRVRVIKAPVVNKDDLTMLVMGRARAIIL